MTKRMQSFIILTLIYLFTIIIGVTLFLILPIDNLTFRLLIADIIMTVIIWIFSMMLKNSSVYDPYWSVIPPILLILLMIYLDNFQTNMFLLLIGLLVWSIRLTYNWAKLWKDFSEQDWRYNAIKDKNPKLFFLSSLFGIHLVPTLFVFAQLANVAELSQMDHQAGLLSLIGAVIILSAVLLQYVADTQMQNFKKKNAGQKLIIREGVWKYSRHPNYLGEILVWWAVWLFYVDAAGIDLFIIGPILMTLMFLFISIPMMEKKMIKSRPEYVQYQKETPMLIPFLKIGKK